LGIFFWLSPDERTKISSPSAKTHNYGINKRIVCFISEKYWNAERMKRKNFRQTDCVSALSSEKR
jgi:hypothetical protein